MRTYGVRSNTKMISLRNNSMCAWLPQTTDSKHHCGYCKNQCGSATHGMWAESLTVADYQGLIDRGWRRSGCYLYKPIMKETCCPQYTIKCDVLSFNMSKSQKKIVKKLNKFVNTGELNKNTNENDSSHDTYYHNAELLVARQPPKMSLDNVEDCIGDERIPSTSTAMETCKTRESVEVIKNESLANLREAQIDKRGKPSVKKGLGADPSRVPCKKAKFLRLERKQKKLEGKGLTLDKTKVINRAKDLENLLNEINVNSIHKLKTQIVCVSERGIDWQNTEQAEYELYAKYQSIVHDDQSTLHKFRRFLVNTPLVIELVRMSKRCDTFRVSAQLFNKYQRIVHNDDDADECNAEQFYSFLVETPLKHVAFADDDSEGLGYGSYHQQYWLDDKLIAVGVLDILPKCVTSVYFFYDPDYRNLTLGTYGLLREIGFARQVNNIRPEIKYYYLGYYIHTCQKMRYKGKLRPSYLLCPETYEWYPIENCINKLNVNKYARFNDNVNANDNNLCVDHDIDNVKIIYRNQLRLMKNTSVTIRNEFNLFANLIGKDVLNNMIIILTQ